jgi:uncharacterized membrane protein
MAFCSACGRQIPEGATACPNCSRSSAPAGGQVASGGGLTDNVAGMLAYFTFIPAILFLVLEPYNRSRFVRFHCFQMIFFCVAMIVIWVGLAIIGFIPGFVFITLPLHFLVWLAAFILWIILVIKANQGQLYKLPIIGDLAEKQVNVA